LRLTNIRIYCFIFWHGKTRKFQTIVVCKIYHRYFYSTHSQSTHYAKTLNISSFIYYIKYSDISCFKFSHSANMSSLRTEFYITRDLTRLQVRFLYLKEVMTLPPVSESKTLNTGMHRTSSPKRLARLLSQQHLTK